MTPQQLTEEYIFAHDLREASAKIYRAATRRCSSTSALRQPYRRWTTGLCWDGGARSWNKACRSGAGTRIRIICERSGAMPSSTSW